MKFIIALSAFLISQFAFANEVLNSCAHQDEDNIGSIGITSDNGKIIGSNFDWFNKASEPDALGFSCTFQTSIYPEKNDFDKSHWKLKNNTVKIILRDSNLEFDNNNFILVKFKSGVYTVNFKNTRFMCNVDYPKVIKIKTGADKCLL